MPQTAQPGWFPRIARPAVLACVLGTAPGALAQSGSSLIGDDTTKGDMFGYAAAIAGETALVGARLDDTDAGVNAGSAYLFDVPSGTQRFKLGSTDAEPGDFFARSVSLDGSDALIGAPGNDDDGTDSGSAYLFDATNGRQLHKLSALDASASDQFGHAVAVADGVSVVSAPWEDAAGSNAGAVYMFDTSTGLQERKLTSPDAAAGDLFGFTVDADAGRVLVGSLSDTHGADAGSAYLFDAHSGDLLHTLTASDASAGDKFGHVALDGQLALVGAPGSDAAGQDAGAAYLFDVNTGQQLLRLTAEDPETDSTFGFSVALSGGVALVGAYTGNNDRGEIFGFDVNTGNQLFSHTPADAQSDDAFGFALGIDGLTAVVGSPLADGRGHSSGAATILDIPPPPEPIVGDLNMDGFVGIEDLTYLLMFWNEDAGFRQDQEGDVTGDGFVGIDDLTFMLGNWNQGTPPAASMNVPEPSVAPWLTGLFIAANLSRRRRPA